MDRAFTPDTDSEEEYITKTHTQHAHVRCTQTRDSMHGREIQTAHARSHTQWEAD